MNLKSIFLFFLLIASLNLYSQENNETAPKKEEEFKVPEKIEVKPLSADEEISKRLESILKATGWFEQPEVTADEGVVFLKGWTRKEEYKKWAGDLSRKTEDVAAVVNQIEVRPSVWDYSRALEGIRTLWSRIIQAIPSIVFGFIILLVALITARLITAGFQILLRKRLNNQILRKLTSRAIGTVIFLLGVYIVFEIAGLTAVAFTIIGGTGILGIILGIAFRDITENILASIFLSIQNPFNKGDLIEIEGSLGYVQSLTMRATVLLSLDGNHIQIPNATVYKGTINNYTSNPKRRENFIIGVGYADPIPKAQEIALRILNEHPAVLNMPEPWVLVDNLGKSTVNLRIYFWLDGIEHSWLKVRSSVIRMIKRAFIENGITLPDEARERIFPQSLTVEMATAGQEGPKKLEQEESKVSTEGESGLRNESKEIQREAAGSRIPEEGEDLLKPERNV